MQRKSLIILILSLFVLTLVGASAIASTSAGNSKPRHMVNKAMDGSENISTEFAPSFGPNMSPGLQMGVTVYDYQHNGSMGRQVAYRPGTNFVHFNWSGWD